MANTGNPVYKIGQNVEYKGSIWKVVNDEKPNPNFARTYVIQCYNTGTVRKVFRHEIFPVNDGLGDLGMLMNDDEDFEVAASTSLSSDPTPQSKRFKEIPTEYYLDKLANARTENTTNKQTAWGVKLFREWLKENGFDQEFEELTGEDLNERLRVFYASAQSKKGNDYPRSVLIGVRAASNRHLQNPPHNKQISIMQDRTFMTSNHVLIGLIKTLKREGKDTTEHKKAISEGDIDRLYTSGVFDVTKPATLQNKVFWDILLNFGRRGQEGLHSLTSTSYKKHTDDRGHEYYKMSYNESDKTHHGINSKENRKDQRMYAQPGDPRCPVSSLELYLSKLSPKCKSFFQQALLYPANGVPSPKRITLNMLNTEA